VSIDGRLRTRLQYKSTCSKIEIAQYRITTKSVERSIVIQKKAYYVSVWIQFGITRQYLVQVSLRIWICLSVYGIEKSTLWLYIHAGLGCGSMRLMIRIDWRLLVEVTLPCRITRKSAEWFRQWYQVRKERTTSTWDAFIYC
jgi:hypothetical protein